MWPLLLVLAAAPWDVGGDYAAQHDRFLKRAFDAAERKTRGPAEIRADMEKLIGGLPKTKTPLRARITGGFTRAEYRVEHVVFESLPGFRVTGNVYVPKNGKAPFPAVLGVAGHSNNGKAAVLYQQAWIALARRGYLVFAIDPMGQGERLEYFDTDTGRSRVGPGVAEHQMAGQQCLLTGQSIARYEVWDGIRAIDYLLSRGDVDPKRIASAGNSGGGTQSAYLAVFEPRLAAAVVSCYMTRWQELWDGPGPQDMEQVFPRFLSEGFDFADFLFAMGGKPSLMTTAIRDYFPIAGARATRDLLRDANVAYFEYDDTHGWSQPRREAMARFLDQKFFGRDTNGKEAPAEPEPDSRLWVTPTGQLANSFGSETVFTLNKARAAQLAAKPRTLTHEELERFLGVKRRTPLAFPRGTVERGEVTVEKLELELETDLKIPALLFRPAIPPRSAPALVAVATAGKASLVAEWEAFAKAGTVVLAVDPRGVGEGRRPSPRGGYTTTYQAAARAWLLGMSAAQFQVEDTLAAFEYLQSRAEVDPARVRLFGHGAAGVIAQLAGALEPRAAGAISEQAVRSWKDIADARIHENQTDIVIPGVLEHFDLADVQRLIAPRTLELVNPAHPAGSLLPPKAPYKERPEFVPAARFYGGR